MKVYQYANTDLATPTQLSQNAEAIAFAVIQPFGANIIVSCNQVSGTETGDLLADDENQEVIVKGLRSNGLLAGTFIVGFAKIEEIENETYSYQYFPNLVNDTDKVLFRGYLKETQTESYTPILASRNIVQLKRA